MTNLNIHKWSSLLFFIVYHTQWKESLEQTRKWGDKKYKKNKYGLKYQSNVYQKDIFKASVSYHIFNINFYQNLMAFTSLSI